MKQFLTYSKRPIHEIKIQTQMIYTRSWSLLRTYRRQRKLKTIYSNQKSVSYSVKDTLHVVKQEMLP